MNWAETIALIKRAGYTQPQIAKECGCSQPRISELATGKANETSYSVGSALRALEAKAKRKLAKQTPA